MPAIATGPKLYRARIILSDGSTWRTSGWVDKISTARGNRTRMLRDIHYTRICEGARGVVEEATLSPWMIVESKDYQESDFRY